MTTVIEPLDRPAELAACARCGVPALLLPGWCCASCIAEIGLFYPEQHAMWREDVKRKLEERQTGRPAEGRTQWPPRP